MYTFMYASCIYAIHACIHAYIHACIQAHIHTFIHTWVCMHECMYAFKHARIDVCMYKCRGNEMMDGQTNKWMAEGVIQFHLSMMKIKLIKDKMQSSSRCKVNINFFA